MPDLNDTLNLLLDSREALASPKELDEARKAIEKFRKTDGPGLLKLIEESSTAADIRHDSYERELYLSRRKPLQDSTFFFGHPVDDAPGHTQAERAAVILLAALEYKTQLESGTARPDMLNETLLCMKSQDWIFHATREPHTGMDKVVKYPSNRNIVVLKGGHVFQLSLPMNTRFAILEAAFVGVISTATTSVPALAALTSLDRDSWASHRKTLLFTPANADTIKAIEAAAFVVCLDDSAPSTPSERCTTFMLNDCCLSNRWLDKASSSQSLQTVSLL
jgi:hypothetical protein